MADVFLDPGGQEVAGDQLTVARARDLAALLAAGNLDYARLVTCRSAPTCDTGGEAVVFEVDVQRPQLRANPVESVERLAAVFAAADRSHPETLALRADFPLVPHTNLRAREFPRSLCLDDRPWPEASLRWTATSYVERVRWWLAQTARGSLHQTDQPLEPLVADTAVPIILPADLLSSPLQEQEFLGVKRLLGGVSGAAFRAERLPPGDKGVIGHEHVAISLRCQPQPHGVIRHHPNTLDELHELAVAADLDLKRALKDRLRNWMGRDRVRASRLIILLVLPKQRAPGGPVEETDLVAVAFTDTIGDIALKLGEWRVATKPNKATGTKGKKTAAPAVVGGPIPVFLLRAVHGLTPARAAELCGSGAVPKSKRVAVGSGALGSQVLVNLARAGRTGWEVIDEDRLLPHNLQRHVLDGAALGYPKAVTTAYLMSSFFDGPPAAGAIHANVLYPGAVAELVAKALERAEHILDMSASQAVARHLAHEPRAKGRRVSLFLNPNGTDLVLLAEDPARSIPLDSLEMQYYRAVVSNPRLAGHLQPVGGGVRYSASCRDVSAQVSTHLVALHAAIGAGAAAQAFDAPGAAIRVWRVDPRSLTVECTVVSPEGVHRTAIGEWSLTLDDGLLRRLRELRASKLPNETGGVLLGTYDMVRRAIYVVDVIPSPPDSVEWPALYIRGCEGLGDAVTATASSAGGQIEYVGEWHSHPDNCSTSPSQDDRKVFDWLAGHMSTCGLPALMAIVGERDCRWFLNRVRAEVGWSVRV